MVRGKMEVIYIKTKKGIIQYNGTQKQIWIIKGIYQHIKSIYLHRGNLK